MRSDLTQAQTRALSAVLDGDRYWLDLDQRVARSIDASCYRLIPKAVLRPDGPDELTSILRFAREQWLSVTFRAAGTSLSGQAIGDDLLVEIGAAGFRRFEVLQQGKRVRFGPGVIGARLNAALAPHGRRIGPDPASIASAMMGGILANNASGMCCGVDHNAYHTLDSMVVILADGTRVDSADDSDRAAFKRERPDLVNALIGLRDEIRGDRLLVERLRSKYAIKNTNGYCLNAFLDHDDAVDILVHLMIGSEGTLGFIERADLNTVPDPPHKMTGLYGFTDLNSAATIAAFAGSLGAESVELLDETSLRAAQRFGSLMDGFGDIDQGAAALLIEFQGADPSLLRQRVEALERDQRMRDVRMVQTMTPDVTSRSRMWRMRKSLFPAVGGQRKPGETVIVEDVCVQPQQLPQLIKALHRTLKGQGYADYVVFGHAKDGNLHFVLNVDLSSRAGTDRYARFIARLTDLVVTRFDGSLKAEHGTGRNMAPFVALEWGAGPYSLMRRLKDAFDPNGILNPGVLINDDPSSHLANLKPYRAVDPLIDPCMDCGFCEPVCPSRHLTWSPRQRIAALRAQADLQRGQTKYALDETCAADGMCAHACPLGINTGDMVKRLRRQRRSFLARGMAGLAARHFGLARRAMRAAYAGALAIRNLPLGAGFVERVSGLVGWKISATSVLPAATKKLKLDRKPRGEGRSVVYFPTCVNATLAQFPAEDSPVPTAQATVDVLESLGFDVVTDLRLLDHCCGTPFFSKGFEQAGQTAVDRLAAVLDELMDSGPIPVVVDVAPCSQTLISKLGARFQILDLVTLIHQHRAQLPDWRWGPIWLHPTCSMVAMGTDRKLRELLEGIGAPVRVSDDWNCCGFAGDRGFLVPQLTASATRGQTISEQDSALPLSACRTCEIALTWATGHRFRSYVHALRRLLKGD